MPALSGHNTFQYGFAHQKQRRYLESAPEEPEEDELSELDPEPLLNEADEAALSSSLPTILQSLLVVDEEAASKHQAFPALKCGCLSHDLAEKEAVCMQMDAGDAFESCVD